MSTTKAFAQPADAWGIVRNGKLLHLAFPSKPDHVALLSNERMARVVITEVADDTAATPETKP